MVYLFWKPWTTHTRLFGFSIAAAAEREQLGLANVFHLILAF